MTKRAWNEPYLLKPDAVSWAEDIFDPAPTKRPVSEYGESCCGKPVSRCARCGYIGYPVAIDEWWTDDDYGWIHGCPECEGWMEEVEVSSC